jgi:hypothetical protein
MGDRRESEIALWVSSAGERPQQERKQALEEVTLRECQQITA